MEVLTGIATTRAALDDTRSSGRAVGFVPTMGALHDGHLSLVRRAVEENDVVAMSIFVNPLQFAAGEDLASYPRDLERDLELAEAEGVDVVFAPSAEEMYPEPALTSVAVPELAATMEGAARPTHFAGVATVVAKLFNVAGPCRAYFGEKDFQQLVIVRRMARDLSFPVEVVGCPIVREPDGLAMSSRNAYLDPAQRAAAPVLHRALLAGRDALAAGAPDADLVIARAVQVLRDEPLAAVDYVALVDPETLRPPDGLRGELRLLGAARFGRTRLLDNLSVLVPT